MGNVYSDDFVQEFKPTGNGSLVENLISRSEPPIARFRDQIESWFGTVGANAGRVLLPALRSVSDVEFYPAFFSLVLHRFVEQAGWRVDFTPGEISRPTFRVTVPNPAAEFDLEAAQLRVGVCAQLTTELEHPAPELRDQIQLLIGLFLESRQLALTFADV